jgi:hypothetical protein
MARSIHQKAMTSVLKALSYWQGADGMPPVRSHRHLSGPQTPEIIVYPNRRRTRLWLFMGAVSSLLAFLMWLYID